MNRSNYSYLKSLNRKLSDSKVHIEEEEFKKQTNIEDHKKLRREAQKMAAVTSVFLILHSTYFCHCSQITVHNNM